MYASLCVKESSWQVSTRLLIPLSGVRLIPDRALTCVSLHTHELINQIAPILFLGAHRNRRRPLHFPLCASRPKWHSEGPVCAPLFWTSWLRLTEAEMLFLIYFSPPALRSWEMQIEEILVEGMKAAWCTRTEKHQRIKSRKRDGCCCDTCQRLNSSLETDWAGR